MLLPSEHVLKAVPQEYNSTMSRTKNDGWVRIFEVPCLERHEKGYTVYKITSRVFPCQCPEASTQVTVWKRFSEFKKLHAEMSSLHAALYLKGTFPPLSKTSYFNRFETAILEERRAAIRATLEFVAAHPPLFTSAPFSRFFEDGDCRTVSEIDRLPPALSPQPSLTDSDISSSAAAPADGDVTAAPPPADSDVRAAPADAGVRVLDPLLPTATAGAAGGPSNLQLLSEPVQPDLLSHLKKVPSPPSDAPSLDTLSECGDGALPDLSDDDDRPQLTTDLSRLRLDSSAPSSSPSAAAVAANTAGQPQPEPEIPELELPEVPDTPPSPPRNRGFGRPPSPPPPAGGGDGGRPAPATGGVNGHGSLPYPPAVPPAGPPTPSQPNPPRRGSGISLPYPPRAGAGTPVLPPSVPPSPSPSQKDSGDALPYPPASPGPATPSQPDPGHYLLTAADAICRAQEAESQCLWSLALSHYKDGIGTLINGVQGDPNAERQEAVKRKTALYIGRAEQLAALCRDTPEQPRRRRLSGLCVEGGRQQLARYQVVGLAAAGRHLIVTDRRLGDGRRYLIKVVVKCACAPESARASAVLPERVSHMVQLHRLVETDTAYYLVLQYLAHGRLFDSLTAPRPPTQSAATDTAAPRPPSLPPDVGPQPPAQPLESRTQPPPQPPEPPVESTTRASEDPSTTEPSAEPSRSTEPPSDPSEPPADPPESGEGGDVMSSSYLQLFADLAASSRRSGSVSLARNLSCPEPEPEPTTTTERSQPEPAERPESDTEWERVDLDRDGSVSPVPTFAAADDGSPDLLLTRSQQLLSAVERTLQDSSRRQREPLEPPPLPPPLRPASSQAVPPALPLAPASSSVEAAGDANAPNSAGDSRREDRPPPVHAPAVRRPTLDEDWWSRGGGDEAGPPPPQPPPPPPAPAEREPAAGVVVRPSEEQLQLWTAQLVTALEQLHRQGVVCGELRPDNVLLSPSGGACLTYFCRLPAASVRPPATHRRRYRAPELSVPGTTPSPAADWWCLGALLWELHGEGPLWRRHPAGPADHTALQLPGTAGSEARALITALLRADPRRRPDALYIRRHAFFDGLDWNRI